MRRDGGKGILWLRRASYRYTNRVVRFKAGRKIRAAESGLERGGLGTAENCGGEGRNRKGSERGRERRQSRGVGTKSGSRRALSIMV